MPLKGPEYQIIAEITLPYLLLHTVGQLKVGYVFFYCTVLA